MRKVLGIGFLALVIPALAHAGDYTLFNAATATGTSDPAFVETGGFQKCDCQLTTAAGGTGTLILEGSVSSSGPWTTFVTFTDPGVSDDDKFGFFTCPPYLRARITVYAAGAWTLKLRTSNP